MKIVPIILLKPKAKGIIEDMITDSNGFGKALQRLNSVGFVPGQEVQVQKSVGRVYRIKAGSDNPFAIRKNLAEKIFVSASDEDVYESYAAAKKANSAVNDLKIIFAQIKKKLLNK